MAVTHSISAQNVIAAAIANAVNTGSLYSSGRLVIYNASGVVISTMALSNPAFQPPVNGQALANPIGTDNFPTQGQTPSYYVVTDCNGNEVFTGLCGTGGDLFTPSSPIAGPVTCTSFGYQAPP